MRTILILLCLYTSNYVFSQKTNFTIKGNVSKANVPMVYIEYYKDSIRIDDSTPVKNGIFEYKGFVPSPTIATIVSPSYMMNFMPRFIIHPSDNLLFRLKTSEFESGYATGSKDNEFVNENKKACEIIDSIYYIKIKDASDTGVTYKLASKERKDNLFQTDLTFIKSHLNSFYSIILLNNLILSNGVLADSLYKALDPTFKDTYAAKICLRGIDYANLSAIGKVAPLFSLSDSSGNYHELKSFKGKYVLVDFWASWCGPCRAENPNFIKAYNFYKDKNFEFIGVSIDNDNGYHTLEWKDAVSHDKTPWLQLIDDKNENVANKYGVSNIPDNVLIDPQGVIIAKGLRGQRLWQTLEKYLK